MADPGDARQQAADELAETIRAGFRDAKDDHHSRCSTRSGGACDCYYRRSAASHDALDLLLVMAQELEAERRELQGLRRDVLLWASETYDESMALRMRERLVG